MHETITELHSIINSYSEKFQNFSEIEFSAKPNPSRWSKKEVVGHLIDSAQNNLRRFVVGQYEATPPKITYDQNFWVDANGYQQMDKEEVIQLWRLINGRIAAIWANMSSANYVKLADTGKNEVNLHSLEWLAADYNMHMKHHINQIIPGSFDVVYK